MPFGRGLGMFKPLPIPKSRRKRLNRSSKGRDRKTPNEEANNAEKPDAACGGRRSRGMLRADRSDIHGRSGKRPHQSGRQISRRQRGPVPHQSRRQIPRRQRGQVPHQSRRQIRTAAIRSTNPGKYVYRGGSGNYDNHQRGYYRRYSYYPWYGLPLYSYGGGCDDLYRRAVATNSAYWRDRYRRCSGLY